MIVTGNSEKIQFLYLSRLTEIPGFTFNYLCSLLVPADQSISSTTLWLLWFCTFQWLTDTGFILIIELNCDIVEKYEWYTHLYIPLTSVLISLIVAGIRQTKIPCFGVFDGEHCLLSFNAKQFYYWKQSRRLTDDIFMKQLNHLYIDIDIDRKLSPYLRKIIEKSGFVDTVFRTVFYDL